MIARLPRAKNPTPIQAHITLVDIIYNSSLFGAAGFTLGYPNYSIGGLSNVCKHK